MPLRVVPSLLRPRYRSVSAVELLVVRHDQVRVAGEDQSGAVDSCPGEVFHLRDEHPRVHHHPIADDRNDVVVEDPARKQLQSEGAAVHDDRVTGVVAALIPDDHVHVAGQEVCQLPFALVTPLGPDYDGGAHLIILLVAGVSTVG